MSSLKEKNDHLQRNVGNDKLASEHGLCGRKCLVIVRGQRRMVRGDGGATVTYITTCYKEGMHASISESRTHGTMK